MPEMVSRPYFFVKGIVGILHPHFLRRFKLMARELPKKPRKVSDDEVRDTILTMCQEAGLNGVVKPEAVARTILPDFWQTLLKRIRLTSKQLAVAGKVLILRKGEPADPNDFKGIYRLQITEAGMMSEEETDG
jgi:hypothetical protein